MRGVQDFESSGIATGARQTARPEIGHGNRRSRPALLSGDLSYRDRNHAVSESRPIRPGGFADLSRNDDLRFEQVAAMGAR